MIADHNRLAGYLRLDPGFKLWHARDPDLTLRDAARNDHVLTRPHDTMFQVIGRLARRGSPLAIVVGGPNRIPRIGDVVGFIALETMGAAVILNARPYAPQIARNPFPLFYRRGAAWPFSFWRGKRDRSSSASEPD
jgi:hypothetical protein